MQDPDLRRPRRQVSSQKDGSMTEEELDEIERGYIDIERHAHLEGLEPESIRQPNNNGGGRAETQLSLQERDRRHGRVVDVVLSDMSEPWDQVASLYKKSLSDPYFRLMNTSGIAFKYHAGSIVGLQVAFEDLQVDRTTRTYAWQA